MAKNVNQNSQETVEDELLNGRPDYKDENLAAMWDKARTAGDRKDRLFKIIAAVDNGEQWSIYKNKIRKNQSLPVSNELSSIRDTKQGAFSIEGFVGEFSSSSEEMDSYIGALGDFFTDFWKKGLYDDQVDSAIENMLTYGTGITLVTRASENAIVGTHDVQNIIADIKLTNIHPSALYPEPTAKNENEANYYFIKDVANINYLETVPMFSKFVKRNKDELRSSVATYNSGTSRLNSDFKNRTEADDRDSDFITYIGKVKTTRGIRWDMVYLFAGKIIHTIEGISPNVNPLVFIREKTDYNSFWGQSTYKQNLPSQLSINEIDSAIVTHAKAQQNPPTVVNLQSGFNIADWAKNRDKPDRIFTVNNGRVTDAVAYMALPDLPRDISMASTMLTEKLKASTGGTDMAQGTNSGSLQTSGGISQILSRATLKDVKTVKQIRKYLRSLYGLIIENIKLEKMMVRYAAKNHNENEIEYKVLDLAAIDWSSISLYIDINNHTKSAKDANRQVISELFQQSVQYSAAQPITEPSIMTVDEYLLGLEEGNLTKLINKMRLRRQKEKELDLSQIVTQIIQTFLSLEADGISPQEAIILVSQEFSYDPGILKGFKMAELAQAQAQQGEQTPGMQGSNQHTNTSQG